MSAHVDLIDYDATPAESTGAVLEFLRFSRQTATATCERHRSEIEAGAPPIAVLQALETGTAPRWAEAALAARFAVA